MREPFPLNDADLALNLFTSFGYFQSREDNVKTLRNINSALKPEGILVLDFLNAYKVEKTLVPEETIKRDHLTFQIRRYIQDNKVVKEIKVEEKGHTERYSEKVELIRLEDFREYFDETGFEIANIFGNYRLEPYNRETSDRLILIASKTNALH
jgi:SAM-dependent methyltransferase